MSTYTVKYERDETGWWIASVKEVKGCHTQGRTIEQARKRIQEALSLFVAGSASAEFIDDITLPKNAKAILTKVRATRKRAEDEAAKLQASTVEAAKILTKEVSVSGRDAGELLGLSHQRVHQLLTIRSARKAKQTNPA